MAARIGMLFMLILLGSACSNASLGPQQIVLLAPFEGRLRDIGYEAIYAARLAVTDHASGQYSLVAVDDGGTSESALTRAHALLRDTSIIGIIVAGPYSAQPEVLSVLSAHPTIVAGIWDDAPPPANVFVLGNSQILDSISIDPSRIPHLTGNDAQTGSEIIAINSLANRSDDTTLLTSAKIPEGSFRDQLTADIFAPQPGPISALTYDATSLIVTIAAKDVSLETISFDGWNGTISFSNGYWGNGPNYRYIYRDGVWVPQPETS